MGSLKLSSLRGELWWRQGRSMWSGGVAASFQESRTLTLFTPVYSSETRLAAGAWTVDIVLSAHSVSGNAIPSSQC